MSLSPIAESSSSNVEHSLMSNVTIEKPVTESPGSNIDYVNIRFTIALAVPVGKCYK